MSLQKEVEIKCPQCGRTEKIKIWESVNTKISPLAKEKILRNELFKFHCANCGHEAIMEYDCLYHDMDKKLLVYLIPNYKIEDIADLRNRIDESVRVLENRKDTDKKYKELKNGYTYRIVKNSAELTEKIRIFDSGLNDMAVEIVKFLFAGHLQKNSPERKVREIVFLIENGQQAFLALSENSDASGYTFPKELYHSVMEECGGTFREEEERQILAVDSQWAKRILDE